MQLKVNLPIIRNAIQPHYKKENKQNINLNHISNLSFGAISNANSQIITNEQFVESEFSRIGQSSMLENKDYKKRAIALAAIKQEDEHLFKRFFKGEDMLDLLWNPEPNMPWYLAGFRKLAQLKASDNSPLFSASDAIEILSDPDLDINDFSKKVCAFIKQQEKTSYSPEFFKGKKLADIIRQDLSQRILFELPNAVDVSNYSADECIIGAKFLDFQGEDNFNELTLIQQARLMELYANFDTTSFDNPNAIKDFPFIPHDFDELEKRYLALKKITEDKNITDGSEYFNFPTDKIESDPRLQNLSQNARNNLIAAYKYQNQSLEILDLLLIKDGYSLADIDEIHKLVEFKNLSSKSDEKDIQYASMCFRNGDTYEAFKVMQEIMHKSDTELIEKMDNYIEKLKQYDFILPQTSKETLLENSTLQNVKGKKVHVVKAKDVPDFSAFVTCLSLPFLESDPYNYKFHNYKIAKLASQATSNRKEIFQASYVTSDKARTAGKYGLVLSVLPKNMHAAVGFDLWSKIGLSTANISRDYYFGYGKPRNLASATPELARKNTADGLMRAGEYSKEEYSKAMSNLLKTNNSKPLELSQIRENDPKLADAIETYLSKDEGKPDENGLAHKHQYILSSLYHNEAEINGHEISGIYTYDISDLPNEYLDYAQENNLPVVILPNRLA